MSETLQAVTIAHELRGEAEDEFRLALVRARASGHSWSEIAEAASLTRAGARFLTRRATGEIDGHGQVIEREENGR
jgi:hypothetical protein